MSEASTARAPGVAARIDEARRLADSGKILEAEQAFLDVLREAPTETDALNFVAICAHERGRYAQALALLERARGIRADDPVTLSNLGVTYAALGRLDQSIDALRTALKLAPELFVARLRLAEVIEYAGRANDALPLYFGAIFAAQGAGQWVDEATTAPGLRPLVLHAMRTVAAGRRQLFAKFLSPLRQRYGAAALARVEKCLAVYLTELPANYPDPKQRPKFLYFPDLPTKKYYEPELFPWYTTLEAKMPAIRDEMLAVLALDNGFEPFLGHFDSDKLEGHLTNAMGPPVWNAFFFFRHGTRYDDNHLRCPATSAALENVPLCHVRDHSPEVCYSVLTAGSHILPHHGVTNTRLVTHLALIVPEDCALVVGGEPHGWEEGRCFTFDDTFEHEAWNRSSRTRVVMLMDVWNPYLTEIEREALTALVPAIGEFNHAAGV
ncbi:MAG TPA: aspartyl/asparaginyl beta-hydroxylase domain-containing protein [Rhodanobacteraceae bacterium]|jgi:aspartate beta-hydroxylase|nr:aspartyl/asparaginyl beta-hydroxylase domain-containing protein [Rhodanobacteraceae bacterium]